MSHNDAILGVAGKDFVILAADLTVAQSLWRLSNEYDKILELDNTKMLAQNGELVFTKRFGEYVQRNLEFKYYCNNRTQNTHETAHFCRSELAVAIRKSPMAVFGLQAGFDQKGPSLYWMDYLGVVNKVNYGAHGLASYMTPGVLHEGWRPDMNQEEVIALLQSAISELKKRMVLYSQHFVFKIVDKDGVRLLNVE